jgi:ketopantoate reductase
MKICVFGAGATGGYMAGELALAGHEVCAIAAVRIWRPFRAAGSS